MQIRRSQGRLYGLGLAVFDGLLFPLLALDTMIYTLGVLGFGPLWSANVRPMSILLLCLCAAVDFLIVNGPWVPYL